MTKTASVSVSKISLTLLRISIGVIYLWFGALKFFHGYSPAEDLRIVSTTGEYYCIGHLGMRAWFFADSRNFFTRSPPRFIRAHALHIHSFAAVSFCFLQTRTLWFYPCRAIKNEKYFFKQKFSPLPEA